MNEQKVFASLTPRLLARKGGARPAMRPQLAMFNNFPTSAARLDDDLGWNDMGEAEGSDAACRDTQESCGKETMSIRAEVVQLPDTVASEPARAEVIRQQEETFERIAVPLLSPGPRRQRRSALDGGRRAAFTLRIDPDRHLRLRLACTLAGRSAQQLMTDALDRLISELPDVSALAAKARNSRN